MLALCGVGAVIVATILHAWYAGNAGAAAPERAPAFETAGRLVLMGVVVTLVGGLILIWRGWGLGPALAIGGAYYLFGFPAWALLLMERLWLVPPPSPTGGVDPLAALEAEILADEKAGRVHRSDPPESN